MKHYNVRTRPTGAAAQLPVSLTSFVGRERELSSVCALLQEDTVRLLTLIGPGGVGKTRLSVEAAKRIRASFADGIFFIALASLSDPSLLLPTLCSQLELEEQDELSPFEHLITSLRPQSLLLLLDNFEHLLSAASLLVKLLAACPTLRILITSQAVLHVQGEQVLEVSPLPVNKQTDASRQFMPSPAMQLFAQRALARKADFVLDQANSAPVAAICRHLDGLPLAIELAAAWINLFPPSLLLQQLESRLLLLTTGAADAPWRQQTLDNTLRWSYDLLSEQEQSLFRLLSIFVGGATLDTVEIVVAPLWHGTRPLVEVIGSLVDKSLIFGLETAAGVLRLSMLETIREYGLERLRNAKEATQLSQAHAEYFLALAEEAEPRLAGSKQHIWLQRLQQEHDNLRTALQWFIKLEQKEFALRLVSALWPFWVMYSHREGHHWFEALVEGSDVAAPLRARALYAFASLSFYRGDLSRATALAKESLALFRELGDERNMVLVLHGLGHVALARHRPADVLDLTAETLPLVRKMEDRWKTAEALFLSAFGYCAHEKYTQARAAVEESLALWREFEYHQALAHIQQIAGYIASKQNRLEAARSYYWESLATARLEPDYWLMTACLVGLGEVAAEQGQWIRAAQLWGAEEALRATITARRAYVARLPDERVVARTRAHLGEEAFSAAWSQGRGRSLEHVLSTQDQFATQDHARHLIDQDSRPTCPPDSTGGPLKKAGLLLPAIFDELTPREIEVLLLIAQGLTNGQIANQLVLSPLTVNTYVRSLYRKLGIRSRSAATRYVMEHGLMP